MPIMRDTIIAEVFIVDAIMGILLIVKNMDGFINGVWLLTL